MAINNIEERIERTIFERLRRNVVFEGYLPDINDVALFPVDGNGMLTALAQAAWELACKTIAQTKGFCVEVYGTSTSFSKAAKKAPRIVIIAKRIIPGDIGLTPGATYQPLDAGNYIAIPNPQEAANMHFDIHLLSASVKQSRFLNDIIQRTLGLKKYLEFYDSPLNKPERFFIRHYNYYDVSDINDSTEENVYSYEVQDLYLFDINSDTIDGPGTGVRPVHAIIEIKTDFIMGYREVIDELPDPQFPNDDPLTLNIAL